MATARPTARTTNATHARIALQGWSALHLAALIGTAVRGLPIGPSPRFEGVCLVCFQPRLAGVGDQGRWDPAAGGASTTAEVGPAREDGGVDRLRLTGYALAQLVLAIVMIVLVVLWL